jgi:predicted alpha/beta superfamily hydrolase
MSGAERRESVRPHAGIHSRRAWATQPHPMKSWTSCLGLAAALLACTVSAQGPPPVDGRFDIASAALGETRSVFVHAPVACRTGGPDRCPVLYLTDAQVHFLTTVATTTFLAREGRVPPLIVVGIATGTDRTRDLTPRAGAMVFGGAREPLRTSGGGERFLDFVEKELVPWVEARYATRPHRVFAGHSFGGLLVLHAFATRPELFQGWIAAAPSLGFEDGEPTREVKALLKSRPPLRASLFAALGNEGPEMDRRFSELRSTLKSSKTEGLRWALQELPDEDHGSVVLLAYYHGLRHLFDGWAMPLVIDPVTRTPMRRTLTQVEDHYRALGERLGYELKPPEALVNAMGYAALGRKEHAEAVRILEANVRYHPLSPNAYDSLGEALEAAGRLSEARDSYRTAVEKGRAQADPNTAAYEAHLRRAEARAGR